MARLSDEEIEQELSGLEGLGAGRRGHQAEFELDDFKASVEFVNRLTPEAEEMTHHPDLEISSTHSEGGLTAKKVELARRIDAVA